MAPPTERIMETVTDERLAPHLFLGGLLALLAVVTVVLLFFFPDL